MKKFINNRKKALLSGVIAIVLFATIGVTLALIIDRTDNVNNAFKPAEVTCKVTEPTWNEGDTEKENVSITNNGNVNAYIRVALVFNWIDGQGNIAPEAIDSNDYTFTQPDDCKWIKGDDGYYYYPDVVAPDTNTEDFINTC